MMERERTNKACFAAGLIGGMLIVAAMVGSTGCPTQDPKIGGAEPIDSFVADSILALDTAAAGAEGVQTSANVLARAGKLGKSEFAEVLDASKMARDAIEIAREELYRYQARPQDGTDDATRYIEHAKAALRTAEALLALIKGGTS